MFLEKEEEKEEENKGIRNKETQSIKTLFLSLLFSPQTNQQFITKPFKRSKRMVHLKVKFERFHQNYL